MIESIKMVGTPIHQFNYLSEESPNKQVRNFVKKLYNGIQFEPGLNYIVGENGSGLCYEIICDANTGVLYICDTFGNGQFLSPIYNADGSLKNIKDYSKVE